MTTGLQHALETLYGLERSRARLSLDGTRALMTALGEPHRRFRSVHVGGTNGKGSVCALIERVLRAAGIRTGLFTSPHLVDFRERIRVEGRWADEGTLERRLERIKAIPLDQEPTFFEVATALGFDHLAAEAVEWAVVEVGLGGRLDCTNVLEPEVVTLTALGLDHTEILGPTLEAVAREKAGIIKAGTPVISAVNQPEAVAVIEATAAEREAPLVDPGERVRSIEVACSSDGIRLQVDVPPWGRLDLASRLRGRHQARNLATALATLSVLAESESRLRADCLVEGFSAARWPGRLEPCPDLPSLWWDGAHNPDGMAELARAWREDLRFDPPAAVVLALSRDKDAAAMLAPLRSLAPARLFVTRTRNPRAFAAETLGMHASQAGWDAVVESDVPTAVRRALGGAMGRRVLLAGSLFAVGEAMEVFGGAPGEVQ